MEKNSRVLSLTGQIILLNAPAHPFEIKIKLPEGNILHAINIDESFSDFVYDLHIGDTVKIISAVQSIGENYFSNNIIDIVLIEKTKLKIVDGIEYLDVPIDFFLIGEEEDTDEEWASLFDDSDWPDVEEMFDCSGIDLDDMKKDSDS
jgi:hypothetical protein